MSQQMQPQPRYRMRGGGQSGVSTGSYRAQTGGLQGQRGRGTQWSGTGQQQFGQQRQMSQQRQVGQQRQMGQQRQFGQTGGGASLQYQAAQYPATFVDHLTKEMRMVLDDSIEVSQVARWCADKCVDHGPEMADCIRLCNEVAEIAELNAKLISKDGYNVLPVTELFVDVAEQTLTELDRIQEPHTEETAAVIDRAIGSSIDFLETA